MPFFPIGNVFELGASDAQLQASLPWTYDVEDAPLIVPVLVRVSVFELVAASMMALVRVKTPFKVRSPASVAIIAEPFTARLV